VSPAIRPIGHEDRLSVVEHLDELRTRVIVCALALGLCFGLAVWQNDALLDVVNRPLERTTSSAGEGASGRLEQAAHSQVRLRTALERGAAAFERLAASPRLDASDRRALRDAVRSNREAAQALPREIPGRQPVTLGVGEPLSTTLIVSFYFAVLAALPLILYHAYAFVLPAFSPVERRVALPLMMLVPVLFAAGIAFGYFVVLPPAIEFLQTFNSNSFDTLVQARPYYSFVALTLLSLGLLFQIPVGVLALTRAGIVSVAQLRRHRRYAVVAIAVAAMLLPGQDPVTMVIEMIPLLVLYELSILLAGWLDRPAARRDRAATASDQDEETPSANAV
jgi:sec-independent protein translocase protein TatC